MTFKRKNNAELMSLALGLLLLLSLTVLSAVSVWASNFVAEAPGLERRLSEEQRQAIHKPSWPLPKEDIPYYWPYPDVPPPTLAEAHPDAKPQPGWTPRQYFNHLCKLEAGDFIYRPVRAEGYYVIRPYFMLNGSDWLMRDRDAVEDPVIGNYSTLFDYRSSGKAGKPEDVAAGKSYRFTEFPWLDARDIPHYALYYNLDRYRDGWNYYPKRLATVPHLETAARGLMVVRKGEQGHFVRFSMLPEKAEIEIERNDGYKRKEWEYPRLEERTDALKSHYGIFWRGISRPHDREMGIGGGEIYVVDLRTNEVLAMQRHFMIGVPVVSGRFNGQEANFSWRMMPGCPSSKDSTLWQVVIYRFFNKVLVSGQCPSKSTLIQRNLYHDRTNTRATGTHRPGAKTANHRGSQESQNSRSTNCGWG